MRILWTEKAWKDYVYLKNTNATIINRINILLDDICIHPFEGIGKPESLQRNLKGYWSRRINKEHRLVYQITPTAIIIASCRYH